MATRYRAEVTVELQRYLDELAKEGGLVITVTWLPKDAQDGPGYLIVSEHEDK